MHHFLASLTQAQLAHIWLLVDGYLAGVGTIVRFRVQVVHKDGLVLLGAAATSELEVATRSEARGTRAVGGALSSKAIILGQTCTWGVGVCGTRTVLVAQNSDYSRNRGWPERLAVDLVGQTQAKQNKTRSDLAR